MLTVIVRQFGATKNTYSYLRLGGDRWFGVGVHLGLIVVALRGQVPGAESPFQVIDIGSEGLSEAAERNGGAVCGRSAVFAALGNLGG